jgi:hypothetical protein
METRNDRGPTTDFAGARSSVAAPRECRGFDFAGGRSFDAGNLQMSNAMSDSERAMLAEVEAARVAR